MRKLSVYIPTFNTDLRKCLINPYTTTIYGMNVFGFSTNMKTRTRQYWNRATILFLIISISEIIVEYVRRNETVCCLIGFGIGVGCCILYRLISNFLTTSTNGISTHESKTPSLSIPYRQRERSISIKHDHDDHIRSNTVSDDMTSSEMSSSISTINLLHDSYHSNSFAGDSGVDCSEIPVRNHQHHDEEPRKYDSDSGIHHDTQKVAESHVMSYISTEKGLERALEQTSRFYTDLEHIALDLGTLTKRYSQSESSLVHHSIDALDWDWLDDMQSPVLQSPKLMYRKQHVLRSTSKNKIRRRLNTTMNQTEYNESDNENRSFDYSTSPLRRKHSSIYFDSTDNTSDDDNIGDETLQTKS